MDTVHRLLCVGDVGTSQGPSHPERSAHPQRHSLIQSTRRLCSFIVFSGLFLNSLDASLALLVFLGTFFLDSWLRSLANSQPKDSQQLPVAFELYPSTDPVDF